MYMLWSHLLYVTLYSNNIYMLVIYLLYVTQFVNNIVHTYGICSPWHMLFKKSHNMHIYFLQYAWTHVATRHGIQLDSVQWDHRSSMAGYHDHVSISERLSQPSVIAIWKSVWQAVHVLPQPTPRDKTCVRQLFTDSMITYHPNLCRQHVSTFFPLLPCSWGREKLVRLFAQKDMSADDNVNCYSGRLSIGNFQGHTPWVFFWVPKNYTSLVQADCVIQQQYISDTSQTFSSSICSCWRTRLF